MRNPWQKIIVNNVRSRDCGYGQIYRIGNLQNVKKADEMSRKIDNTITSISDVFYILLLTLQNKMNILEESSSLGQ